MNSSLLHGPVFRRLRLEYSVGFEGKLNYMNDPKLKDQDPGPFKAFAVPFGGKH